jgi:hypothetical protein
MHNTPNLTPGYEPKLADQIARTAPGMAHFAGSGPPGATCVECRFYQYWAQHRNKAGEIIRTELRRNACGKYHDLTNKHGPAIPHTMPACRHFETRRA